MIGHGAKRVLVRVDARTLEPLRNAGRIRLPQGARFALSPNLSRVAVDAPRALVIADTASGRVVRRFGDQSFDASEGFYWVGSSANPLIIAVGDSGLGYEYTALPGDNAATDTDLAPAAALRGFLVLTDEDGVDFFSGDDRFVSLDKAPPGPDRVVADVAHNRVFVVFSAGVVATVGKTVTYHSVPLNSRPFDAIWAGNNRIALWGADGLGVIDTRTWSTHPLAPAATGAVATRYGIVAWNANAIDGLAVYSSEGRRRLHVLTKKEIENVTALGRFAYARSTEAKQYAIDLENGRVREIRADAQLAVPTIVSIP